MKPILSVSCAIIAMIVCCQMATAQIPRTLSYQGVLTDTMGTAKSDGTYTITFHLYDVETDGSPLWTETKQLQVKRGLFSTMLADQTPFDPAVRFDRQYWLGMRIGSGPELAPRTPLSAVAYSLNTSQADSARVAGTIPNNSVSNSKIADGAVTSSKIQNGSIEFADIAQNGATDGQVMKWSGSAWAAAADLTGGGGPASGWIDTGTRVSLSMPTDTLSINSSARLGKVNMSGDLGMGGQENIFFGTTNTYLGATPGENLTLRANNDLRLNAAGGMTALAADNINIGHFGDATWIKIDNASKRMGIGMDAAGTVDDRLHVENADANTPCWMKVETSHPGSWGQAGLRIKTPQNMWNLRMDLYSNANLPDGALSLHSQDPNKEVMTWLENGNVGVGTIHPSRKLHVYGSAQVKDTLYAGTINAGEVMNGPGLVHDNAAIYGDFGTSWTALDSVTINAPGPGYILLVFTGSVQSDHTYGDDTDLSMKITKNRQGNAGFASVYWRLDRGLSTGFYDTPTALHGIDVLASGGPQEYFFVGERVSNGATVDAIKLRTGSFSALFIPASYGTVESSAGQWDTPGEAGILREKVRSTPESLTSRVNALTVELEALKKELASGGQ